MTDTNLTSLAVANDLAVGGNVTVTGGVNSSAPGTASVGVGIIAHAGGGQASATALTKSVNSVDTVGTAADSVKLLPAVAGLTQRVTNNTATSMQVFGSGTETINIGAGDVATATGVAHAANKTAEYICTVSAPGGKWQRIMTS